MSYEKNKGRSATERFVSLPYYLLNSEAYASLPQGAKAAYIEFKKRYNSRNNGYIGFSERGLAREMRCAVGTASGYIEVLIDRGFIRYRKKGAFNCKERIASEFILTEYEYNNQLPTKDFMRWEAPEK